jgi:predicted  nucleic acid-binding Zn-ribbon protein
MTDADSGKSGKRSTTARSGPASKGSAAAEADRLAAEKEASDDRMFALTHRVAALEARERDLNELIIAHRERIASLNSELEAAEQLGRLEARGDMLERALSDERNSRSALEDRHAKLQEQLEAVRDRERDLLMKLATFDAQVARLESERHTLKTALADEQSKPSVSKPSVSKPSVNEEQEAELQAVRESERQLQQTIEGMRERVERLESERQTLRSALAEEQERMASRRDELQRELKGLKARLEQLEGSRTYRLMRITWRFRARLRHPFRRTSSPALTKGKGTKKAATAAGKGTKKAAPAALPSPSRVDSEQPLLKPMPKPAMRPKVPKPAGPVREKAATPKSPEAPVGPAPRPKRAPDHEREPETPTSTIDPERELWLPKAQAPPADVRQLRVAGILDEMSAACFQPDCDLLRIESEGWQQSLEAHEPHLLLVESTWQGNNGSWQYMVGTYTHPDYIGLPNLKALVRWCRTRDIPTVFWNKEDPVHFERFKEAAALFDYVFTSDANCVERYAALEREGTGPISSLQFAAQPRLHNPVGAPVERSKSPVFAGAYYRDRHIDRQRSLQMLLDAAMPFGLQIYDRVFGREDQAFGFPERFMERVQGALPYDEMIDAYRAHRIFLNVNSVHDSPTMFSRRVFELLACGTAVVSSESLGLEQTLGDVVAMVETSEEATEALTKLQDEDYWRELSRRGRRRVISEHTYRHRLAEIGSALGFNVTPYRGEEVAALALVDDVEQARRFRAVVASVSAQETRPAELLIGSYTSVVGDLQELQPDGNEIRVRVVQQDPEATRSQRYRELAALASSPWLAMLHPAHSYGEHHLTDLVLTTRFADAEVIGNASFETSDGSGAVDWSLEHRFVDSVHPHSALVKRDLVARRGWPDEVGGGGGSLSDWFRQGIRIYSADAGNFQADAALGLPDRAAAAGSERGSEG